MNVCSVEGCDRPVVAHGLCMPCYQMQRRTGSTARTLAPRGKARPRHHLNIEMSDEAWARLKAIAPDGRVGILARRLLLAEIEKR